MEYFSARHSWRLVNLRELWEARELFWILVVRDLTVRYRQTAVGIAWAILQPLTMMAIFALFFSLFRNAPTESGVPYALTFLCGYLPWQLFAGTLPTVGQSIVSHQQLVTKVYFPRAVLPLAATFSGVVEFALGIVILAMGLWWWGINPSFRFCLLPVAMLQVLFVAFSLGIWFSALNVKYRDVTFMVPFLLQVGFFVSPIMYETNALIPEAWRFIYNLNPIANIVQEFRWIVLAEAPPNLASLALSHLLALVILIGGLSHFRRVEYHLADQV